MFTLIQEALSFDDVSLLPNYSDILPQEVNLSVALTSTVSLNIPLLSCSTLNTLTEVSMAIALARQGGIGIISKNTSIEFQVGQVKKVKTCLNEKMADTMREVKDLQKSYAKACYNDQGQLRVGAAIGVDVEDRKRAESLIKAGTDVLVVDAVHGHSQSMFMQVAWLKKHYPTITLIAGNIVTGEAALALYEIGVDAIKVGVDSSSANQDSSVGVPLITAIANVATALQQAAASVSVVASGISSSKEACKALAAGAHLVTCNDLLIETQKNSLENISSRSHIKMLDQLLNGLRTDMAYLGCHNLEALHEKVYFVKINSARYCKGPYAIGISQQE